MTCDIIFSIIFLAKKLKKNYNISEISLVRWNMPNSSNNYLLFILIGVALVALIAIVVLILVFKNKPILYWPIQIYIFCSFHNTELRI